MTVSIQTGLANYFSSSLLKKDYPQAYIIYPQAYMKVYPQPCTYNTESSKNVDENFLTLYYLGKKIDNILYIVVLDSFKKVNKDFILDGELSNFLFCGRII